MTFDENLTACAKLVEKGDPARFRTVMAAPLEARAALFPLYAFNVEVSRAPWLTEEPIIAEMRLQWWQDALEEIAGGGPARRHEVVSPLAGLLGSEAARALMPLVAARRWDCYRDAFEDEAHQQSYLRDTSGQLASVAAGLTGGDPKSAAAAGTALGVANFLRAIPELQAAKRVPMVDGTEEGVRRLARFGLAQLTKGRSARGPASWPAAGAGRVLRAALSRPGLVREGALPEPRRVALPWAVFSGRL